MVYAFGIGQMVIELYNVCNWNIWTWFLQLGMVGVLKSVGGGFALSNTLYSKHPILFQIINLWYNSEC